MASAIATIAFACLQGQSLLCYAATKGCLDIVDLLLSKGADVNAEDGMVSSFRIIADGFDKRLLPWAQNCI